MARSTVWTIAVPLFTYAVLVLAIWAPGARYRGLNYETTLVYDSQTRGILDGFAWAGDPLRMFTSFFYHLSYVLALVTGNGGDYIFYQYVYAGLWFARGALVFATVRRLLPLHPLAAFIAGGLTIVHASDGAINWVGQLNQFGFMFWLVLAAFCMAVALTSERWYARLIPIALAADFEFLCLWSYESPLPIIVALPVLFFLIVRPRLRSTWWLLLVWYVVPAIYVAATVSRYLDPATAQSYQESVVSKSFTLAGALGDWLTHITYSLEFWRWNATTPAEGSENIATLSGFAAALALLLFGAIYGQLPRNSGRVAPRPVVSLAMLGVGFALLALSFPVYLLLEGNTGMWRTQMLSGFGTAIVATSIILLLVGPFGRHRHVQTFLALGCGAVLVFFGTRAGVRAGVFHEAGWEKHRAVMSQVVHLIPNVRTNALILLVDLPKAQDPFGDAMWFDFPVRLSYPSHTTAGGLDYLAPETADNRWRFDKKGVHWDGRGYAPPDELRDVPYKRLVLLEDHPDGRLTVLAQVPPHLTPGIDPSGYDPAQVIAPGPVQPENERRFAY